MLEDSEILAQIERSQANLVDFLRTDLTVAFTFLETAGIDAEDDPAHSEAFLEKARTALETVRHLGTRIDDPAARKDILKRADDLESAIGAF